MLKAITIFVFALAVVAAPALAAFTVSVDAPEEMFAGNTSVVKVTVNNSGAEKFFTMSQVIAAPPANTWANVQGAPAIRIPMEETGTFNVALAPSTEARAGTYSFSFTVSEQGTGERVEGSWSTTVRQRVSAALIRGFNLSCSACTGDSLEFSISVENIGSAPLRGLRLSVSGAGQQVPLDVGELALEASKKFTGKLNLAGMQPGDYPVKVEFIGSAGVLDARSASFKVPLVQKIDISKTESFTLWSKTVKLTATNHGNAQDHARITAAISNTPLASISFEKNPDSRSGSEVVWASNLQPGVSTSVSYTEFYWPIPVVIVAVILAAIYAYLWSTALVLTKHASKREGEWVVSVTVINRGRAVDGIVVRDIVPPGFKLGARFETLKPITRGTAAGIELLWRVGGMRKGEQRILHYRIAGERAANLPPARLSAKRGERTLLASSDPVELSGTRVQPKLKVEVEK